MDTVQHLEQQREAVLGQMRSIRSMERGSISEQYFPASPKNRGRRAKRGPYYVLSRNEGGQTVSRRLPAGELEQARADVVAHHRYVELCRQYERLTEQLGQMERAGGKPDEEKKTPS